MGGYRHGVVRGPHYRDVPRQAVSRHDYDAEQTLALFVGTFTLIGGFVFAMGVLVGHYL